MGNSLASQASWCLDMGSAGKRVIDLGYYRLGEGSHPGGAEILRTARGRREEKGLSTARKLIMTDNNGLNRNSCLL